MPTEPHISANNRQFILQALSEKQVRLDGRPLDKFRPIQITFCDEGYGYAEVQAGKTRVAARVTVEVTRPNPDRKFDGIVTVSSEFSPLVAPSFEIGRPSLSEHLLSRHLEKTLLRSSAIDTESLCLLAGSKCFHLRIDLHVLAHDGNLIDISSIACLAALRHFRRPDFEVHGEAVTIFSPDERELVPLAIRHSPFTVTLSLFPVLLTGNAKNSSSVAGLADEILGAIGPDGDGEGLLIPLVDATRAEESVRITDLVVSANKFGDVCAISKSGTGTCNGSGGLGSSGDLDARQLLRCVKQATALVVELDALVTKSLEEDGKRRSKNGLLDRVLKADNER